MPELPEVETIKEDLRALVVGGQILRAEVLDPLLIEHPSPEEFVRRVEDTGITGCRRRAKHLILELGTGDAVVFQLKIGGQLLLVPPVEEPITALMLVLQLDGDRRLFLRDQTGYTRAQVMDEEALEERFAELGPEPLGKGFGVEYLRGTLLHRRAQIKPLLLDQKVVAGIGNIYADETLYDARLHPRRKGHHQDHLRVFLRAGKPCPSECGGKVVKEKVGGRATFLCPACQRENWREGEQRLTLD